MRKVMALLALIITYATAIVTGKREIGRAHV